MRCRRFFHLILLIATHFTAFSQNDPLYFPPKTGNAWTTLDPAALDFCPERIDSLYAFLETHNTKSFILLQDGKIVLEKYFGAYVQDSVWYWASAGKSLTAFLIGQAQKEGLLDIDDPTSDYLGAGWTSGTPAQEAAITIRHQLTMTTGLNDAVPDDNCTDPACLQFLAAPGTRWAYHNAPYRLLHDVVSSASGLTINQFTKTRVLDRTGMKGFWFDHVMYGRARDMARFGLLTLAGGVWDGDTLLHDPAYLYDMAHPSQDLNPSYGYLWWLNGQPTFMLPGLQWQLPGPLLPNAPPDLYAALGKNDQKIHVVPSKGWVVVRQGEAAGFTGPGGGQVPIVFDNMLWSYLNALVCAPSPAADLNDLDRRVNIAPNPSSDGFWQIRTTVLPENIEVLDACGQPVWAVFSKDQTVFSVNGSGWPSGVYWLRIGYADGVLHVEKLVKTGG